MDGFQEYQLTYRKVEIVHCDTVLLIFIKYMKLLSFAAYSVSFLHEKVFTIDVGI